MSFRKNYVKIYAWQTLSIVLGFATLLIITPFLSANKSIYGVYSLCVSLTIFVSYVDFGFISACYKFAGEAFAREERAEEYKTIGFVSFLLFIIGIIYASLLIGLSYDPRVVFSGLIQDADIITARRLLMILGIFSFNMLYQRILQVILGIRLEDYVFRRFSIVTSCATIASSFFFFRKGCYDIVGYFLFAQIMSLSASAMASVAIVRRYDYSILDFFRAFKFDKAVFVRTKGLAFSSLFGTAGWIIYYELDSLFISKMIGVSSLAYYSASLTLVNFVRSLLSTLFTPFQARFNHLQGTKDYDGLKRLYGKVIQITKPMIVFPLISIFVLMEPLIFSWLGSAYSESVGLGRILICIYAFAFFQYPAGILLNVKLRLREMNVLTLVNIVLFWLVTLSTYRYYGVFSIASSKLITFIVSGFFFIYVSAEFEGVNIPRYLWNTYRDLIIPCIALVSALLVVFPLLPRAKGSMAIAEVVGVGGIASGLGFCIFLLLSREYQQSLRILFKK